METLSAASANRDIIAIHHYCESVRVGVCIYEADSGDLFPLCGVFLWALAFHCLGK